MSPAPGPGNRYDRTGHIANELGHASAIQQRTATFPLYCMSGAMFTFTVYCMRGVMFIYIIICLCCKGHRVYLARLCYYISEAVYIVLDIMASRAHPTLLHSKDVVVA